MEMRVARKAQKNIDVSQRHLSSLKTENDALRDVVFNLEEEMNAKNSEIDDLNEKADHPTRPKLEFIACRVDALENKLDTLQAHIVHQDYQEFLAEEAAAGNCVQHRAKINDALDRAEHASEVDCAAHDMAEIKRLERELATEKDEGEDAENRIDRLEKALAFRSQEVNELQQRLIKLGSGICNDCVCNSAPELTDDDDDDGQINFEDLAPGEHMVDPGDVFNSAPELTDDDDDDEDEYIDPIERIMSEKPVGQFPPEDADTPEKRKRAVLENEALSHELAALRRAELSSQTKGE
jgi:hypothetical protein